MRGLVWILSQQKIWVIFFLINRIDLTWGHKSKLSCFWWYPITNSDIWWESVVSHNIRDTFVLLRVHYATASKIFSEKILWDKINMNQFVNKVYIWFLSEFVMKHNHQHLIVKREKWSWLKTYLLFVFWAPNATVEYILNVTFFFCTILM